MNVANCIGTCILIWKNDTFLHTLNFLPGLATHSGIGYLARQIPKGMMSQMFLRLKNLVIVLVCLYPILCSSQKNFRPGYIVTISGDTLRGLVAIQNNYTTCALKANNKRVSHFSVDDGIAFCHFDITNERFEPQTLPLAENRQEKLFAQCLVKSDASLYLCRQQYFFQSDKPGQGDLARIPLEEEIIAQDGRHYFSLKKYFDFLHQLSLNCPLLGQFLKGKNLEAQRQKIIEAISLYNDCQGANLRIVFQPEVLILTKSGLHGRLSQHTTKVFIPAISPVGTLPGSIQQANPTGYEWMLGFNQRIQFVKMNPNFSIEWGLAIGAVKSYQFFELVQPEVFSPFYIFDGINRADVNQNLLRFRLPVKAGWDLHLNGNTLNVQAGPVLSVAPL